MTSVKSPYDTLYANLKDRFTVVYEGCDCTLGDYMLIKAGKRQMPESSLPAVTSSDRSSGISDIVEYVTSQLTVKTAPAREKTLRRFPLRSSASAVFTAAAACALVFSFGIFALKSSDMIVPYTAAGADTEYSEISVEDSETENTENK